MKALILKRPGSIGSMQVLDIADPDVQDGEVLVQLEAASLNPLDYKLVLAGHPSWKYPHIPGIDGVGTIIAIGSSVDLDWLGKRVVFHSDLRFSGSFAQKVAVRSEIVVELPNRISSLDAACLPCAGLTAWDSLKYKANLKPGQTVVVQAAAGGVGAFALQIARHLGARIIATCSPNNNEYVRSLGATETIDYSTESLKDRVLELTEGKGAHAIIDTMGTYSATIGLGCLGYGGHLICLAGLPDLAKHSSASSANSIHDVATGAVHALGRMDDILHQRDQLQELVQMLDAGILQSPRSKTIALSEIPAALEELRDRHVRGKIVADLTLPIAESTI